MIALTVMALSIAAQADWRYEASADGKSDKIVSTGGWTFHCSKNQGWREVKVYLIHAPSPFDPVGMQVILR